MLFPNPLHKLTHFILTIILQQGRYHYYPQLYFTDEKNMAERLRHLPEITQLEIGRTRMGIEHSDSRDLLLTTVSYHKHAAQATGTHLDSFA